MESTTEADRLPETRSVLLHRKIELVSAPFVAASKEFITHPRIARLYPEYLITLHCIVRSSVPVMEAALGQATRLADTDPASASLTTYLKRHIDEERNHDQWLLDDLEALGVSRSTVMARLPSLSVACLVGSQYYWVLHRHPVALLGYLAFAEGYPSAPTLIEELVARTGHPREAFRTLIEHAHLDDSSHGDELDEVIDSLLLTPDLEALLGLSAISTVCLMARCLDEVLESVARA